jgi:fibronectin-binding autotransporter adhesin
MKYALSALLLFAVFAETSSAATRYWDRNGSTAGSGNLGGVWDTTSSNWNNNSNGNGSTNTFASGDTAIFSAGTDGIGSITITGNATAGGLTIEEGTVEFTGTITLGANAIAVSSGAVLVTNDSARLSTTSGSVITLNGGTLRSINPVAGSFIDVDSTISLNGGGIIDYTISNILSTIQSTSVISGSGGLTKNGVGVIALASASTYSGGTTVNGGELRISGANDRLPTTGNVVVNASGILNLNDRNQTIGTLAGSGQVGLGNGTLTISSSASATFSGDIKDTANAGAGGSSNTGGKLIKSGTGTQTLSGSNTYTGGTSINGGTLALGSSGAIGTTGTIGFGGGTLQFSASNTSDYSARFSNAASQAYSLDTNGQTVTIASNLTSSGGSLTKVGTGTLTVTGANTYTGGTTLGGGNLSLGSGGAVGTTGTISFTGGTLQFSGSNTTDYSSRFSNAASQLYSLDTNGQSVTIASNLTSSGGSLTKAGAGTLTVSGANTYSGGTTLGGGTLALGSSGAIGTTGTISFGGGTLQFSASNTTDYSARFNNAASQAYNLDTNGQSVTLATALTSSGGSLTKLGAGTLSLTGANTYTGVTTISAGTLSVGNGGTTGSLSSPIADNAALIFNRSNALTHSGNISGTGTLTKQGAGVLTLSGSNSYLGGTTLSAGTLSLGSSGAVGTSGTIDFSGGTLQFSASNTTDYSARFSNAASQAYSLDTNSQSVTLATGLTSSGGTLTKLGAGTLTLTGANTYTGATTISAGTLSIGNGGTSGSLADGITDNAGLIFNRSDSPTHSGNISGTGTLTKQGAGTLTLSGSNSYSGGTTLSAGALNLGSGGAIGTTGTISFGGGTLQFSASNATDYSARFSNAASQAYSLDTNSQSVTLATALTSSGGTLTKLGAGTLTLTAANTYSGATTISAGILSVGNGGTTGSIADGITNNASLIFNRSNALTHSGNIGGTGTLTQQGGGVLTLSGSNSYSGGTTLNAGTLNLGSSGAIATTGTITFAGGILQFSASNTTDYSARFSNAAGQAYNLDTNSQSVTLATGLTSSGGTLTKLGAGTLSLSGANTYSGVTTISAGTLSIGNGGTTGSVAGDITNNASLIFNRSNALTYTGNIGGTGSVTKQGAGTTTLSGTNSYSGGTTLSAGTLGLGSSGAIGTTGTISFGGGTMQFSASNTTDYSARFSNAVSQAYSLDTNSQSVTLATGLTSSGGTLTKLGAGTLVLTGANTYTGTTTISAGTLSIGNGGTSGSIADGITDNSSLVFNRSDAPSHSGNISGTGTLTQQGAGTLTLTGSNSYSGGTTLSAGILNLGSSGAIGTSGTISFGGGTLQFSASNTTDYSARFSNAAGQAYSLDTNSQSVTLATGLTSSGGTLTKLGAETLTMTGANTYSGVSTISAGTLSVGNGGSTGSIAGDITNNASLVFNRSNALTHSGNISGTGTLATLGGGTLTLAGANSYSGGTTLSAGTLSLGSVGAIGSTGTIDFSGGTLQFSASNTTDYSARFGNASGQAYRLDTNGQSVTLATGLSSSGGTLTKLGAGTLALTGANTYTGGTIISAGILSVGDGGTTGSITGLVINNAALTFDRSNALTHSDTITGTGPVTKQGAGVLTLTAANTYSGGTTISDGTLLANNTSGSATGDGNLTVASGATLGGNGSIGGAAGSIISVNGTLSPGASIESLSVVGNIALNDNSTYRYEIDTTAPYDADLTDISGPGGFGLLSIGNNVTLTATDLTPGFIIGGVKFTLFRYATGGWNGGTFAGLPDGKHFFIGPHEFVIDYDDTVPGINGGTAGGEYVTIATIPEPSALITMGLVVLSTAGAVWFGKRKGISLFSF